MSNGMVFTTDNMDGSKSPKKSFGELLAEELMDLITEDRLSLYRDVIAGRYELIKSDHWSEDLINKKVYVKDMEIFDKVVPLFVSMSKLYEPADIKEIFNFCRNKNQTISQFPKLFPEGSQPSRQPPEGSHPSRQP